MKILVNRTALIRAIANAAGLSPLQDEQRKAMFARQGQRGGGGGGGGGSGSRTSTTTTKGGTTTVKTVQSKPEPKPAIDVYPVFRYPPYIDYPPELYRPLPVYPGIPTYPEKPPVIRPPSSGYKPPVTKPRLPIEGTYPYRPGIPERPIFYPMKPVASLAKTTKKPTYTTKDYTGTSVAKVIKVYQDAAKNPSGSARLLAMKPKK
mgnify:CR=1 FL=1